MGARAARGASGTASERAKGRRIEKRGERERRWARKTRKRGIVRVYEREMERD
jgi:hypothetical protein